MLIRHVRRLMAMFTLMASIALVQAAAAADPSPGGQTPSDAPAAPPRPMRLSDFKDRNNVLILFSPSERYRSYRLFMEEWKEQLGEVQKRDLVLLEVFEIGPSRLGERPLTFTAAEQLRQRFEVQPEDFCVVVLGKSGKQIFKSVRAMPADVFRVIDQEPPAPRP